MGRKKIGSPREVLIQTRVPEDVAAWVAELAYETGETASGWLRRLVMRDYRQSVVRAMVRNRSECNPLALLAHFSATHYLSPSSNISPQDREFVLLSIEREPLSYGQLMGEAWFREPNEHRFILEGSPMPWRVVALIGPAITLHADLEWKPPRKSRQLR